MQTAAEATRYDRSEFQPMLGKRAVLLGGLLSAGIALLHVVIIFVGAPAYRYFGAA